jgi:hypothetical protein
MMRNKRLSAWILGGALCLSGCSLEDILDPGGGGGQSLEQKVVTGLKTALKVGIDTSAAYAARVNGYFAHEVIKILLPEEAEDALAAADQVSDYVKPFAADLKAIQPVLGLYPATDKNSFTANLVRSGNLLADIALLDDVGDSLVKYMNRAAEYAAPRSVPIFKEAITGMTVSDGLALLNGADSTAATAYLNGKTFAPLVTAYTPVVDSTLALVPLTKYWGDFRATYNRILSEYDKLVDFQAAWNANSVVAALPALQVDALTRTAYEPITTESLGAWTTDKALGGLFWLVGEEEREIRRDPYAYVKGLAADVSGILEEVFGEIMEMR